MPESASGNGSQGERARAYRAGARIARERISHDDPRGEEALRAVDASDVVVVPGCYDHVERVLDALALPFTALPASALARAALRPEQLLVLNCPGQLDAAALGRVRDFVAAGGSLFTTDWALRHVIEPAFPGTIAWSGRPTGDDVVGIEVRERENPFLRGVLDDGGDPQWWLEGSSYPIRVLDPARVRVLIASRELGERYGEPAVAVLFRHGEGEVFHMISHYYLQRTELRSARHAQPAAAFAAEQGLALSELELRQMDGLTLSDVESAASSARLFANVVHAKKQAMLRASERRLARARAREARRREAPPGEAGAPPTGPEGENMA
jgi:hypothetical protein